VSRAIPLKDKYLTEKIAFTSGDPYTLLVPRDSAGSRCGLDHNVKDKPYLFFFDLTKCFGPTVPFTGCPTTQVCVKECPSEYFYFPNQEEEFRKLICSYDVTPTDKIEAKDAVEKKKCAEWYLKSQPCKTISLINLGTSWTGFTQNINFVKKFWSKCHIRNDPFGLKLTTGGLRFVVSQC
jgi:hypothetical protein